MFVLLSGTSYFVDINTLLSVHENTLLERTHSILLGFLFFSHITIPTILIGQMFYAFFEPEKIVLFDLIRGFLLVLISLFARFLDFTFVMFLLFFANFISRFGYSILFYRIRGWKFKFIRPKIIWIYIQPIIIKSLEFWVLAILAVLQGGLMPWMIAKASSLIEVSRTGLILQIFTFILVLQLSFLLPIQSRYTLELAIWSRKVYLRSLFLISCIVPIFSILIYLFLPILELILKKKLFLSLENYFLIIIWLLLWSLINATSVLLNGFGQIKVQIVGLVISQAIAVLPIIFIEKSGLFLLMIFINSGLFIFLVISMMAASKIIFTTQKSILHS